MNNENDKPFCKVPFLIGFNKSGQGYRDCCAKQPQLVSDPGQDFDKWWHSNDLNQFRQQLSNTNDFPRNCNSCKIAESHQGSSFRTAVNKWKSNDYSHPAGWNISFGNTCNLACWICDEKSSSVIFQHKKRAGLTSGSDQANLNFEKLWPDIRKNILKSYEHHDVVNLTLLGGEPLYNKNVISFLTDLVDKGLSHRTSLEFHTNGTVYPDKVLPQKGLSPWQHVSIFISLDATGAYAEWLRYGCKWDQVDTVVDSLIQASDYAEIQCTLTVLNINQLQELEAYAKTKNCKLSIETTENPDFMSLMNWDLGKDKLLINRMSKKFQPYYDLIGTTPKTGTSARLKNYIRKFDGIRKPLKDFDENFANKVGW